MRRYLSALIVLSMIFSMFVCFSEDDRRYETLSKGDKGEGVKQLQIALIAQGYLNGSADGDFGKMTEAAVSKFQSDYGIKANGIADEKTLELLYELETERLEKAKTDGLESTDSEAPKKVKPEKKEENIISEINGTPLDQYSIEELINICCAIKEEVTEWNEIEPFNVPVGKWTVGEHLNPGVYSIISYNDLDQTIFDVKYQNGSGEDYYMRSQTPSGNFYHLPLNIGDQITIEDESATFATGIPYPEYVGEDATQISIDFSDYEYDELVSTYAYIMKLLANQNIPEMTITAGVWTVGKDIPAGTYDISAYVEEEDGNYDFRVFADITKLKLNTYDDEERYYMSGFGNGSSTNASNCELKEGNVILANGCRAKLKVFDNNVFFGK